MGKADKRTEELNRAVEDLLRKDDKPYTVWIRLKDLWYQYDKRLNDPAWLIDVPTSSLCAYGEKPVIAIADLIGCSERLVRQKIKALPHNDQWGAVNTSVFHWSKKFLVPLIKPFLGKIQKGVDTVYTKIETRNGRLFKQFILGMEIYDDDDQDRFSEDKSRSISSFWFKIPRKAFYILMLKFAVCLYEFDPYYRERADYLIGRLIAERDQVYLDETSHPANWYPNRTGKDKMFILHYINARKKL